MAAREKGHGWMQLMTFVMKHTGMFQRVGYDRYDPRLLEQMYGCLESDLSYGRSVGPNFALVDFSRYYAMYGVLRKNLCKSAE